MQRISSPLGRRRKALQLAREVLRERPGDIREALRGGLAPKLAAAVDAEDAGVREGALSLLALLVQHPGVVHALQQARRLRFCTEPWVSPETPLVESLCSGQVPGPCLPFVLTFARSCAAGIQSSMYGLHLSSLAMLLLMSAFMMSWLRVQLHGLVAVTLGCDEAWGHAGK